MSSFSSAYLSTRLSIFSNHLIDFDFLTELFGLDLEQILKRVEMLTGHDYSLDAKGAGSIENQLANTAFNDFQLLIRPFSGRERRFFFYAIRWFELVNLKVLIRGKFSKTDNSIIQPQLIDLGDFAELPLNKLLDTEDTHEMLRLLETTAYAGIVRQARQVYEEHGNDLFLLDATIDRSFFISLKQRLQALDNQDATQVSQVMGVLLDRFNLLWLLRYRFSYNLSPAKSYYLLTASGRILHSANLMRLAKMDSVDEVLLALPASLQKKLSGLKTIYEIETVLEYSTLAVASKALSQTNLVSRFFAYIILREAETRFLQALIKGKQLGFDDELIKQAVVGIK